MPSVSSRCPNCPGAHFPILGDGPEPCPILGLGERPAARENDRRQVFCGPSGDEIMYNYLRLAGIERGSGIRLENCVRCWAAQNRTPSDKELASCTNHFLPGVFQLVKPELLLLMGASACKVMDKHYRIDTYHGRPVWGSVLGGLWTGWIWISYHPALGMHDTTKMNDLLADFERLGEWMQGEWKPPVPVKAKKDYRLIETDRDLDASLYQIGGVTGRRMVNLAMDTESHGPAPFSIQISHKPHYGRFLRVTNKRQVERFAAWSRENALRLVWLMHNAPHDLDEAARMRVAVAKFRDMGVAIDHIRDTQQEAFHQGDLPQGLKPLAYRLLGVTMQSWEDVVWPASIQAVTNWLREGIELAGTGLAGLKSTGMKTWRCLACGHKAHMGAGALGADCKSKAGGGSCQCTAADIVQSGISNVKLEHKPATAQKIMEHVLRYTLAPTNPDEPYDPWKKLPEMRVEGLRGQVAEAWEWEWLESQLGPVPILGIGNCELGKAVRYGCSDSDYTGQVATELEQRRGGDRWQVQEEDWDQ